MATFPTAAVTHAVGFHERIAADLIDAAIQQIEGAPFAPAMITIVDTAGGAISSIKPEATAYAHRQQRYTVFLQTAWTDRAESERRVEWSRGTWKAFAPLTNGTYANFAGQDKAGPDLRETYGGNLERLVELKRKYDGGNLFRLNANVPPRLS